MLRPRSWGAGLVIQFSPSPQTRRKPEESWVAKLPFFFREAEQFFACKALPATRYQSNEWWGSIKPSQRTSNSGSCEVRTGPRLEASRQSVRGCAFPSPTTKTSPESSDKAISSRWVRTERSTNIQLGRRGTGG